MLDNAPNKDRMVKGFLEKSLRGQKLDTFDFNYRNNTGKIGYYLSPLCRVANHTVSLFGINKYILEIGQF